MSVSSVGPFDGLASVSEASCSGDDDAEFGLFQALPVADVGVEDYGWEVLPQSVEEYLARVRSSRAPCQLCLRRAMLQLVCRFYSA